MESEITNERQSELFIKFNSAMYRDNVTPKWMIPCDRLLILAPLEVEEPINCWNMFNHNRNQVTWKLTHVKVTTYFNREIKYI